VDADAGRRKRSIKAAMELFFNTNEVDCLFHFIFIPFIRMLNNNFFVSNEHNTHKKEFPF
jgi:hypothetical protein